MGVVLVRFGWLWVLAGFEKRVGLVDIEWVWIWLGLSEFRFGQV